LPAIEKAASARIKLHRTIQSATSGPYDLESIFIKIYCPLISA